jgi:hypothetical protein
LQCIAYCQRNCLLNLLYWAEMEISSAMENMKMKITLDWHGPRLIPNHCHHPIPTYIFR